MAEEGGLRPYASVSGSGHGSAPLVEYKVLNGETDDMFEGDLIVMEATGTVTVMSAASEVAVAGVFVGCEYTNSDGQRVWSNKYNITVAREDTVAFVNADPFATFIIRAGTGDVDGTVTRAAVGASYDIDINAGNGTTGMSGILLDTGATAATAQLRVVGVSNKDGQNQTYGHHTTKTFTHAIVQIDPGTHLALGAGI
jgi:hypothetical protein